MGRLARSLDAWWFQEGSAARLAALRLIIGTAAWAYLFERSRMFVNIAASSSDLFEPVGPVMLLNGPIAPRTFEAILYVTQAAGIAFVLGWRFRWTGPLFAVLFLLVMSYRNSWSMIYHSDNMLVLHLLVLGLTRSADSLSLDALGPWLRQGGWRRLAAADDSAEASARSGHPWHWEYGYPVRLLCAVTVAVYVLSGTAKLAGPLGVQWALGEGLRSQVGFDALRKELLEGGSGLLAHIVFNNIPLATALGIGTIVLELGSIAALLDARVGRAWAVAAFGMHWGIYAVMGITFWYQLTGLAFVPFLLGEGLMRWGRDEAYRWVRALTGAPPGPRTATVRTDDADGDLAPAAH